jgi:hypothetical protein
MDESIFKKCMLLVLEQHRPGETRAFGSGRLEVRKDDGEADPEDDAWHGVKRLFGKADAYVAIRQLDSKIRSDLDKLALPANFQRGAFAIPLASVTRASKLVADYRAARAVLVDAFVEEFPAIVESQRSIQGALFSEADYPPVSRVREAFSVGYRWIALDVPESLQDLDPDLFEAMKAEQAKAISEQVEQVKEALRATMKGLIDHLLNRLSQKDDKGRVKQLRASAVGNIVEFLDMLPAKNIAGDGELAALADKARAIVTATDVDSLREDQLSRRIVEKRLGEIVQSLDGLIEAAPRRRFGGFEAAPATGEGEGEGEGEGGAAA